MEESKLTVYSKPGCRNCFILKKWLSVKNIPYNEVDITEDKTAYNRLVAAERLTLPQVIINDEFVDYSEMNDILTLLPAV